MVARLNKIIRRNRYIECPQRIIAAYLKDHRNSTSRICVCL